MDDTSARTISMKQNLILKSVELILIFLILILIILGFNPEIHEIYILKEELYD